MPVAQLHTTFGNAGDFRVQEDLDFSLRKLALRVDSEFFAKLRQDHWSRMNQHNANHVFVKVWIAFQCAANEVIDPGDGFHSRESASSNNEGEQRVLYLTTLARRFLQMCNQVISQTHRVAERFHRQRTFFKPGDAIEICRRSEAQHEVVVFKRVLMVVETMRDDDLLRRQVHVSNFSREKIGPSQHFARRVDDRSQIEVTRSHLVQQEKILAVYQSDLDAGIAPENLLQLHRRGEAGKASSENQDPLGLDGFHKCSISSRRRLATA